MTELDPALTDKMIFISIGESDQRAVHKQARVEEVLGVRWHMSLPLACLISNDLRSWERQVPSLGSFLSIACVRVRNKTTMAGPHSDPATRKLRNNDLQVSDPAGKQGQFNRYS